MTTPLPAHLISPPSQVPRPLDPAQQGGGRRLISRASLAEQSLPQGRRPSLQRRGAEAGEETAGPAKCIKCSITLTGRWPIVGQLPLFSPDFLLTVGNQFLLPEGMEDDEPGRVLSLHVNPFVNYGAFSVAKSPHLVMEENYPRWRADSKCARGESKRE